jgi:hypothetical protein
MKKYIAFGLYQKNEQGAYQEAMEPGEAKEVYREQDVRRAHGILRNVLKMLDEGRTINPTSIVHDEIKRLMKRVDESPTS